MVSQINKRLEVLEQRVQVAPAQPMQIIGTALAITTDAPHTTTADNIVTFHAASLRDAYALREQWMAKQENKIFLIPAGDSGDRVLEVLAEKHA